jgi:hypothetical protein
MMRLRGVVLYPGCDPVRVVGENAPETVPIREARAFDRFAAELAAALGTDVRVDDSPQLPVPGDGVLFICRQDVLDRSATYDADLRSRIVLVDVPRGREVVICEQLALAAAVGNDHYFTWERGNTARRPGGIVGLRRVADIIGAQCSDVPSMSGEHYALMTHPGARDLIQLLARYLSAYATQCDGR